MKAAGSQVGRAVVSILAGVAIVGGGLFLAGMATASDTKPAGQETAASTPERPRLLRGAVHGTIELTYVDGSTRTFTYDRGQITSITDTQITLVRRDQKSVTLDYDDSTFVREEGEPASVSDLAVGDRAMFFSEDGSAKLIRCISKEPPA
jgi:hypothetical protein